MELDTLCPKCHKRQAVVITDRSVQGCSECLQNLMEFATDRFKDAGTLTQCPVCGCVHLYRLKDFNRKLGIGILVIGIGLAYFTYGISLLAVTVIDFLLVRRVREIGCCYKCGALFRDSTEIAKLDSFNLSLHDYYRNLKR